MNTTKINFNYAQATVDAVMFPVTTDDLLVLAHGYYMERLSYEYESWAGGGDFEPSSKEGFEYHFAGERLTAIEAAIGAGQMSISKKSAEQVWLHNNRIDNDLWMEFRKAGRQ